MKRNVASGVKPAHKWIVDSDGRITNFTLKALRGDIIWRLQSGSSLYTLEECRMLLLETARVATRWQEEDFTNLLYLNELHQKILPGRMANYQWPIVATPVVPFSKPSEGVQDSVLYRVNKVVEELNRSIVRMIDKLWNDRRERLLLGARMLKEIEAVVSKEATI